MTYRWAAICAAILALAAMAPLAAHHSFAAEFDSKQPLQLTDAITKVDWTNPHVYFYIDVKDDKTGRVANWSFEMAAPAVLTRSGWKRSSMKTGDVVKVDGTRARDGSNHGNARSVTLAATGEKLGAGSSETATEAK